MQRIRRRFAKTVLVRFRKISEVPKAPFKSLSGDRRRTPNGRPQSLAHAMKSKSLQKRHRAHAEFFLEGIFQGSLAYCGGFAEIRYVEWDIDLGLNIFFDEPDSLTVDLVGFVGAGDRVVLG